MPKIAFGDIAKLIIPWQHRHLIQAIVMREIDSRYRNSVMGWLWSIISPFFTLMVYTLVFKNVFSVKWLGGNGSSFEFAILIFIGMTVFGLFSECVTRAPALITSTPNYVKKIVFPLEILPWTSLGVAVFHMGISLLVLLAFYSLVIGLPHWTVILYPVILLPLILMTAGLSWIFSAIGVYFRDAGHIIGALLLPLMFLTPIFYPTSTLPAELKGLIELNPLAQVIENARMVLYWGKTPDAMPLLASTLASGLFAFLGLCFFQKSREGFADVL